ncbi:hypothetical protein JRQ81_009329 [Phrynocephalus forsythii]|uniref:SH2 domain-containing adapter protein E n=1 Tax=Phrynocephalus forsythii TaxID=171643 RepID=A0A9Q0XA56_9SAUR|nr:hypothetical protein JRQ81_009329 [Phrynocephalus forsythii]
MAAKWFKEFPANLKTATERTKPGSDSRKSPAATETGTASLPGKTRKNSATELSGPRTLGKDAACGGRRSLDNFQGLLQAATGKMRKNSRVDGPPTEEMARGTPKGNPGGGTYINRLIKVDAHEKNGKTYPGAAPNPTPTPEPEKVVRPETVIILEDYADPYDAKRTKDQREAERLGENDGYMEPYDAQQMITVRGRQTEKKQLCQGIYCMDEMPTQEISTSSDHKMGERGFWGAAVGFGSQPGGDHCKVPPWGWCPSQQNEQHPGSLPPLRCPHPEFLTRPGANNRKREPKQGALFGQEVALMCTAHGSHFKRPGARHSHTSPVGTFAFVLFRPPAHTHRPEFLGMTSQGCVHIIVAQTKDHKYTLDQAGGLFDSVPEVVRYYATEKLPFKGAEHMTLRYPVPVPGKTH